jgi:hypothetical protein
MAASFLAELFPSHASEAALLSCAGYRPHIAPMEGSPLKRARKQGVRLDDGSIVAFPYLPRVAALPSGWRHFATAEKIEHLIGIDRAAEILSWGLSLSLTRSANRFRCR